MRFFDLQALQREHKTWKEHNFPDEKEHQALLGLIEEVGELAHAHLKYEQRIRGYDRHRYVTEALDAVGDIIIYLASYCNTNDLDLESAVMLAWEEVSDRDWIKYPETGRPSVGTPSGTGRPPFTGDDRTGTGQPPADSHPERGTGDIGGVGSF